MSGKLYVVGTPIGNLDDMVPRAVQVLQSVDVILAEDTRHSANLLRQLGILTPLRACHDHNEKQIVAQLIEQLKNGANLALISDAGTPLISDPGFNLVQSAREVGIEVIPVPGACAAILALSAAGVAADRFSFVGFPPAKETARGKWLEEVGRIEHTTIIYEAPHRILSFLQQLVEILGAERFLVIGRELTKKYESWYRGEASSVLATLASDPNHQRGEFVVILEGEKISSIANEEQIRQHMKVLLAELPLAKAAGATAKLLGVPRQDCYQVGLQLSE